MLKILCHLITHYPPYESSGANIMCERMNTYFASKGCDVLVVVNQNIQPYEHKGVKVVSGNTELRQKYQWADVIITHLINRSESTALAGALNKPLFHVCHNDNTSTLQNNTPNNYIIYNSEYLKATSPVQLPGIVVNPPTWLEDYQFADHFNCPWHTLVNCIPNKGIEMLYQLATEFALLQFRGIKGGYGQQVEKVTVNSNLHYRPFTQDMNEVYRQTRVILVPSIKESWSLTAAEAQCSGIPVICSDLPGLRENLGEGAIYCNNKREFMQALNFLMVPENYKSMAAKGYKNAVSKNYKAQLDNLLNFMCMKAGKEINGTAIEESGTPLMPTEKVEIKEEKEKKEFSPFPEKKKVGRPSTKNK